MLDLYGVLLVGLIGMMATSQAGALLIGSLILLLFFFIGFIGGSSILLVNCDRSNKAFRQSFS